MIHRGHVVGQTTWPLELVWFGLIFVGGHFLRYAGRRFAKRCTCFGRPMFCPELFADVLALYRATVGIEYFCLVAVWQTTWPLELVWFGLALTFVGAFHLLCRSTFCQAVFVFRSADVCQENCLPMCLLDQSRVTFSPKQGDPCDWAKTWPPFR